MSGCICKCQNASVGGMCTLGHSDLRRTLPRKFGNNSNRTDHAVRAPVNKIILGGEMLRSLLGLLVMAALAAGCGGGGGGGGSNSPMLPVLGASKIFVGDSANGAIG